MALDQLYRLTLLFFFYAFIGWCTEVTLKYIQYHRFINRGFLAGPVCPIYGAGALLITLFTGALSPIEHAIGTTFILSFVVCGTVEYLTSYVQEKLFHARWWDYSQKPMNLNGRIWIGNLILFGLGGIVVVYAGDPLFDRLFVRLPHPAQKTVTLILLAVFIADCVNTQFILKLVRTGIRHSEADDTEEIKREIAHLFSDRNVFYRRFVDAYPEVVYRTERVKERLKAVQRETELFRQEAEEQYRAFVRSLEAPSTIRSRIISKQGRLIEMLYDADHVSEEAAALKSEIDGELERLNAHPLVKTLNRLGSADAFKGAGS